MLWDVSAIDRYAIEASNGRLGTVSDLLFEDVGWVIRWLVVDTGNWLPGREPQFERSTVVRADRPNREDLVAAPGKQHRFAPRMAEQHSSIRDR
jgi:hypothetical protein